MLDEANPLPLESHVGQHLLVAQHFSQIDVGHEKMCPTYGAIRHICLNLLQKQVSKLSVRKQRYRSALNDDFRAKVLFG